MRMLILLHRILQSAAALCFFVKNQFFFISSTIPVYPATYVPGTPESFFKAYLCRVLHDFFNYIDILRNFFSLSFTYNQAEISISFQYSI